ncbi:MAG: hypothetical protein SOZ80_06405 [Prevotella sp.]|uniref:hypothetical protein n=1 Tax=Prevotella sp. TaxID=59823 RepID=UPI002A2D63E3|nr:hypothetical protein [Prevotella sp.]MDD7318585.1 hypothetical protein [Prevotellaceae bacterium]MDY4020386.1 hypothetical protein [Prevotella sp.]
MNNIMISGGGFPPFKSIKAAVKTAADGCGKLTDMIADFYGRMLERKVSRAETIALIKAQSAFLLGIMPIDMPLSLRLFFTVLTLVTVNRCRHADENSRGTIQITGYR